MGVCHPFQLVWYPRRGTMNITYCGRKRCYVFGLGRWVPFFTRIQ